MSNYRPVVKSTYKITGKQGDYSFVGYGKGELNGFLLWLRSRIGAAPASIELEPVGDDEHHVIAFFTDQSVEKLLYYFSNCGVSEVELETLISYSKVHHEIWRDEGSFEAYLAFTQICCRV